MREEMAIVEELHDINRKLTAGIQVDTYGEMRVINRAANAITRLTEENAKLKREVDMAEKQSLDFYVEKENAAEREAMLEQLKEELEDRITLPTIPPEGLLLSMAIRFDHGLGVEGYYDDPMFGPPSHQKAARKHHKNNEPIVRGSFRGRFLYLSHTTG